MIIEFVCAASFDPIYTVQPQRRPTQARKQGSRRPELMFVLSTTLQCLSTTLTLEPVPSFYI